MLAHTLRFLATLSLFSRCKTVRQFNGYDARKGGWL